MHKYVENLFTYFVENIHGYMHTKKRKYHFTHSKNITYIPIYAIDNTN